VGERWASPRRQPPGGPGGQGRGEGPEGNWQRLSSRGGKIRRGPEQESADICFVPNAIGGSRKGKYRFLVIREPLVQQTLPEMGEQLALPFPVMEMGRV